MLDYLVGCFGMGETFVRVTNKEMYHEIKEMREENRLQHEEIMARQMETNGKVKMHWVLICGLSSGIAILTGFFVKHLMGG